MVRSANYKQLCGALLRTEFDWVDEKIAAYEATLPAPGLFARNPGIARFDADTPAYLWPFLLACKPSWRRGAQGIGDCVSWGAELAVTMLMALHDQLLRDGMWEQEAATEPIYGGGRADIKGRRGGWSDGSWGAAAAEWLHKWGVLLRKDYSKETGNSEHDLTTYSSKKAKNWGNYGCGGQSDELGTGKLDMVAKKMPVKEVAKIRSVEELEAALRNGYPCTIASGVGFGRMQRNSEGIVRRSGSWAHQMMFGGTKRIGGEPHFREFQSWGASCSGPDPGINNSRISECSWWCTPGDAEAQIRGGDCWAFSDQGGMPARELDFGRMIEAWG